MHPQSNTTSLRQLYTETTIELKTHQFHFDAIKSSQQIISAGTKYTSLLLCISEDTHTGKIPTIHQNAVSPSVKANAHTIKLITCRYFGHNVLPHAISGIPEMKDRELSKHPSSILMQLNFHEKTCILLLQGESSFRNYVSAQLSLLSSLTLNPTLLMPVARTLVQRWLLLPFPSLHLTLLTHYTPMTPALQKSLQHLLPPLEPEAGSWCPERSD